MLGKVPSQDDVRKAQLLKLGLDILSIGLPRRILKPQRSCFVPISACH